MPYKILDLFLFLTRQAMCV